MNSSKIMRIHHTDGTYVGCFLGGNVPRLYAMTEDGQAKSEAEKRGTNGLPSSFAREAELLSTDSSE